MVMKLAVLIICILRNVRRISDAKFSCTSSSTATVFHSCFTETIHALIANPSLEISSLQAPGARTSHQTVIESNPFLDQIQFYSTRIYTQACSLSSSSPEPPDSALAREWYVFFKVHAEESWLLWARIRTRDAKRVGDEGSILDSLC